MKTTTPIRQVNIGDRILVSTSTQEPAEGTVIGKYQDAESTVIFATDHRSICPTCASATGHITITDLERQHLTVIASAPQLP